MRVPRLSRMQVIARLEATIGLLSGQTGTGLVPIKSRWGKVYEAWVLSLVCERLAQDEHATLVLVRGSRLALRAKGGWLRKDLPYLEIDHPNRGRGILTTNLYCLTLSHELRGAPQPPTRCDFHELDIALVDETADPRPTHKQVWLAIECKETSFTKNFCREALGLRRELSMLRSPLRTGFTIWPMNYVPADPPSSLCVYSTDPQVADYDPAGSMFGVRFIHEPLPR